MGANAARGADFAASGLILFLKKKYLPDSKRGLYEVYSKSKGCSVTERNVFVKESFSFLQT